MISYTLSAQTSTTVPTWTLLIAPLATLIAAVAIPWVTHYFNSKTEREKRENELSVQKRKEQSEALIEYAESIVALVNRVENAVIVEKAPALGLTQSLEPLLISRETAYFKAYMRSEDTATREQLARAEESITGFTRFVTDLPYTHLPLDDEEEIRQLIESLRASETNVYDEVRRLLETNRLNHKPLTTRASDGETRTDPPH